ncbi:MAG: hypothetical protein CL756_05065 [Chloroflexi bacterium]|nr:hypothetical protein [Chloroflexota bacterium]|tara:strand:- start:2493 stop:3422 length:930 start_codon:yes stop_codon:yes gene_type:complete
MQKCNFITTTGDRCLSYVFTDQYQERKCIQGHRTEGFVINPLDLVPKEPILNEVPPGTDPLDSMRRVKIRTRNLLIRKQKSGEIAPGLTSLHQGKRAKTVLANQYTGDRTVYYFNGSWFKEKTAPIWNLDEMKQISRKGFNKFSFTRTFTSSSIRNHNLVIKGSEILMEYLNGEPPILRKNVPENPRDGIDRKKAYFFTLEDAYKNGFIALKAKRNFEDYLFPLLDLSKAEKNKKVKIYKSQLSWYRSQLVPRIIKTCIATYVKDFKDPELLTTPIAKNPNDKQKIAELIFNSHLYGMKPPKETRELVV